MPLDLARCNLNDPLAAPTGYERDVIDRTHGGGLTCRSTADLFDLDAALVGRLEAGWAACEEAFATHDPAWLALDTFWVRVLLYAYREVNDELNHRLRATLAAGTGLEAAS